MSLSAEQIERYSRQTILAEVGDKGQEKLLKAGVLIVGVGGLGSPAAMYLAAAGVGTIGIIDRDSVELSNLQRQIVHSTVDLGRKKTESARDSLTEINPDVTINIHDTALTEDNADDTVRAYDFILDCTDNFASKFLVADVCHRTLSPYSHAGILRFSGQTMTVIPDVSACYRCVFEGPVEECAVPIGPLGVVPGVIGTIQATEAIKYVVGCGELLTNRLLIYDALGMTFRSVRARRNTQCPLCGR